MVMKFLIGQQNKTRITEAHGSSVWVGLDFAALLKAVAVLYFIKANNPREIIKKRKHTRLFKFSNNYMFL